MFRVLDYNFIGNRLFSLFFTLENNINGKYDIVILDRDSLQNNFENAKSNLNDGGKIIVDIVGESGCINNFFTKHYNNIIENNKDIDFYLFSDFDSIFRKKYKNAKCLIDCNLSNYCFFGNPMHGEYLDFYETFSNKQNQIMSLNGSIRHHRILFLLRLIQNDLLNKMLCSFRFYTHDDYSIFRKELYNGSVDELFDNKYITLNEKNQLLEYKKKLPISFDDYESKSHKRLNPSTFLSAVNVVTENTYDFLSCKNIEKSNTFTEKTLIPFIMEQMPIFVARPYHVKLLRGIGYDVFDDIIDHSYDYEDDAIKRMDMIISEIKRIINFDFVSFYNENKKRFLRNRELTIYNTHLGYQCLREFLIKNDLF